MPRTEVSTQLAAWDLFFRCEQLVVRHGEIDLSGSLGAIV